MKMITGHSILMWDAFLVGETENQEERDRIEGMPPNLVPHHVTSLAFSTTFS